MSVYTTPASVLNAVTGKRVTVTTARGHLVGVLSSVAYDSDGRPEVLHIESPAVDVNFDALAHPVDVPWHAVTTIARIDAPKPATPVDVSEPLAAVRIGMALDHLDALRAAIDLTATETPDMRNVVLRSYLENIERILTGRAE